MKINENLHYGEVYHSLIGRFALPFGVGEKSHIGKITWVLPCQIQKGGTVTDKFSPIPSQKSLPVNLPKKIKTQLN
jgi:hypothetical protein